MYHRSGRLSPVVVLPVGTLTFVLTDLVASTRSWETQTRAMRAAMERHDEIVYAAVARHRGVMVESGRAGDSIFAVFRAAKDAASCAIEVQRAFRTAQWPERLSLRIRIALHTGEVELRGGHYFGPALNRCARVLALCHGGQSLTTQATRELLVEDPPADVELTDLGLHRLKDLRRLERLYQLTDLRSSDRFPPLHSRPEYRTNLPILLTSFVGRERELAELRTLLHSSRLLTLTGTGGAGKTRLAKRLASEVAGEMPAGVWFVELAPVSDPRLVARTVASALDVEEQQGRPLIETLVDHCAGIPMLLVLDNCEHLLEACAQMAETLLASCPKLRVVATSREPLNLGGEVTWRVPSLAGADAIQLFAERARLRSQHFELSDDTRRIVAEICERLDGIPLAIELAAARAGTLPLEEVRRRLERGLALLAGGSRTAAKRQQTLEATIDWSYDLLSDQERRLLRRISIFAGRFSIDAAEAVCVAADLPRESIIDHLSQLISKSLLQRIDDRFLCLETIRAYARSKLEAAGELGSLRQAHAMYFMRVAESRRPGGLATWLDQLEEDHDDLREALQWSLSSDPATAARFSAALYEFWLLRGYALEARSFLEELVRALSATSSDRARALLETGVMAYTAGDLEGASRAIDEGLLGARAANDPDLVSRGLVFRGNVALAGGDAERAGGALEEALAIAQETGNTRREADARHHLGTLALVRGDLAGAFDRFTESLELRSAGGAADETGITLMLRAFVSIVRLDRPSARRDISEALEIGLALRDRRAAWSLNVLSCLVAMDGSADRALRLGGAAEALFESTGQAPPPVWHRFVAPHMERARGELGPSASQQAWQGGRALSFEQALRFALDR